MVVPVNNDVIDNDVAPSHRRRRMDVDVEVSKYRRSRTEGVQYQKYRSIGIELSQVSRYFDISNIEPALVRTFHLLHVFTQEVKKNLFLQSDTLLKNTVNFVFTISSLDYKMNIHPHLFSVSAFLY